MLEIMLYIDDKVFISRVKGKRGKLMEDIDMMYENINELEKLKFQLTDGAWLILGQDALKRAFFKVKLINGK